MGTLAAAIGGCAPEFNWREFPLADTGISARLPCRPASESRPLAAIGDDSPIEFSMRSCDVGGVWFGVGYSTGQDPAAVGRWLSEWDSALARRFAVADARAIAWTPPGCTPHVATARRVGAGHLPDGRPVTVTWLLFTYGTTVVQATAYGERLPPEAAASFADGLRCG